MSKLLSIIELIETRLNISAGEDGESSGASCLRDIFNVDGDDSVNMDKIDSMEYLYELGKPENSVELDYVESKIVRFIEADVHEISECFSLYTFTQDLCKGGLSNELLPLLGTLLSLKTDIEVDSPFIKDLDRVESRLSKYIPGIINKIIHFSEVYEKKNCNNKVSNNTIILRKLYSKIINANIYSSDGDQTLTIDSFFNSFQTNIVSKTILLLFIAYMVGKLIGLFNVNYNITGK